jgi:hypothetical protein
MVTVSQNGLELLPLTVKEVEDSHASEFHTNTMFVTVNL